MAGEKAVSTTNPGISRGRMGHVDSEVYLAGPAVASECDYQKITDPREVMK